MVLLILVLASLVYLFVIGIINLNVLFIVIGGLGLFFGMTENVKLLTWRVKFFTDYLFVPSSTFDRFIFGKNTKQKISYTDIEKVDLQVRPAQILFIKCKNKNKTKMIYVKQFSKKQIEKMMQDIIKSANLN
jgi:hypothetical protein